MHSTILQNDSGEHTNQKLSVPKKKAKPFNVYAFDQNDFEINALQANLNFLKIYAEQKGLGYTAYFLGKASEFVDIEFNQNEKGE